MIRVWIRALGDECTYINRDVNIYICKAPMCWRKLLGYPPKHKAEHTYAITITMASDRDEAVLLPRNALLLSSYVGLVVIWGLSQVVLVSSVTKNCRGIGAFKGIPSSVWLEGNDFLLFGDVVLIRVGFSLIFDVKWAYGHGVVGGRGSLVWWIMGT